MLMGSIVLAIVVMAVRSAKIFPLATVAVFAVGSAMGLTLQEADMAANNHLVMDEDDAGLEMVTGMSEATYAATGVAAFIHPDNPARLAVVPDPNTACALTLGDRPAASISAEEAASIGMLLREAEIRGSCWGDVFLTSAMLQVFIRKPGDTGIWIAVGRNVPILRVQKDGLAPPIAHHLATLPTAPTYLIALHFRRAAYRLADGRIRIVVAISQDEVVIRDLCADPPSDVLVELGGLDAQNRDRLAAAAVFARGRLDPIAYVACLGESQ